MAFEPDTNDRFRELREAIEAGDKQRSITLHRNLFSSDHTDPHAFFQIAQMILSGAGASFNGLIQTEGEQNPAQRKQEKERKESRNALWQNLILSEQIRALEARAEEIRHQIHTNEVELEKIRKEIDKIREDISDTKKEIDQHLERNNYLISEAIPEARAKSDEAFDNLDRILELSPVSNEAREALHTSKELGKELITVSINPPGFEDENPPRRHVVYQNEDGQYYVLDKDGKPFFVTDPKDLNEIQRQKNNGEEFGGPHNKDKVREFNEQTENFRKEFNQLPEEMRKSIIEANNNNVQARREVDRLETEFNTNSEKLRELYEQHDQLKKRYDDLKEQERDLKEENERLKRELRAIEENIKTLEQQQIHNKEQTQGIIKTLDTYNTGYREILSFSTSTAYQENLHRFADRTIGFDEVYKDAPDAIKALVKDPEVRARLEEVMRMNHLPPEDKAAICGQILKINADDPAATDPTPAVSNSEFSTMPACRAPNAGQLSGAFGHQAGLFTDNQEPSTPAMSRVVSPEQSPLLGAGN